jgi:hypothetical protein
MVTTIEYITTAIRTVFKDKDDLTDAQSCLKSESSIPTILSCLDEACSCSFSALANLRNDPPPQAVAEYINSAIIAADGTAPNDAYVPRGTLGSFYSCESLDDTTPLLIATGSNTIKGMQEATQECVIYSVQNLLLIPDTRVYTHDASIYFSLDPEGPCYEIEEFGFTPIGYALAICMYGLDGQGLTGISGSSS